MPTVLLTGTSRGIGLELAASFAESDWSVLATCRAPAAAHRLRELERQHSKVWRTRELDLEQDESIQGLGASLAGEAIDVLVHCAGWGEPRRTLEEVSYSGWERAMRIHAYSMLKLAQVLRSNVERSSRRTMVAVSSQMGSIHENVEGLRYAYRASKAALNMIVKTLSIDLAPSGVSVVSVHPGWARTAMGGPNAPLSARECGARLKDFIERLTPADSGKFLHAEGRDIPW